MVGSAVETMVWSSAASSIVSISAPMTRAKPRRDLTPSIGCSLRGVSRRATDG